MINKQPLASSHDIFLEMPGHLLSSEYYRLNIYFILYIEMYLKRDRLIRKQIKLNMAHPKCSPLSEPQIKRLQNGAHQQLSLAKIISREMDYSKIELFLLLSTPAQRQPFYNKLSSDLSALFGDEKAQITFENKWTLALKSNVMGCFSKIALDFFEAQPQDPIRYHLTSLYVDTIDRLISQQKLSRIEEKFLEPFLVEAVKFTVSLESVIGPNNVTRLSKSATTLSRLLGERQTPKTLTSNQFLKYCALRALNATLPHQKYLHNQLLHAPNPKYLLPFRRKGTFLALTNELLLKSNKLDLVGCQFWSYYEYEEGDLYERIRRAAQWGGRVDILLALIRPKLVCGLERCLNLTNEKVIYFSSRQLTEQGLNALMALVETALFICRNKSQREPLFDSALQKIDIGQIFQHSLLREPRLRPFVLCLLELYLLLLIACPKRNLRLKFVPHLALQLHRLLDAHSDHKFTTDITRIVVELTGRLSAQERAEFLYGMVQAANHQWESSQQSIISNELAQINPHTVRLLAELVAQHSFEDEGRTDYKVLKLEFYYILALNYKESEYFESKKKLSRTLLDINPSLANNSVFAVLETKKTTHGAFRAHLLSLYGESLGGVTRPEHEGLLAVIDEVVTYRIQQLKTLKSQQRKILGSFYSLMVSLLEQVERLQPSGKLLKLVREYFLKCKKTYFIEVISLKGRDQTRSRARQLITQDVSFLVEGCVSSNPTVAEFCWEVLQEYISRVPELAIYTGVLVVWAECISILYRKSNQEYESRSERLRGRFLVSGTPIPTERKIIMARLGVLMIGLYSVVLRGHLIDDDYQNVRIQYLIRENCKSASFGFGWKCLKHFASSFREDHEFIDKQVLRNNSCSWFVNDDYFNTRLDKLKPDRVLNDISLIPLHRRKVNSDDLKQIFAAVQPQVETEFVTIPSKGSEGEVMGVVREMERLCSEMELNGRVEGSENGEEPYSSLFDVLSRVKMIYITKLNQAMVFANILDVCRRYAHFELLQHTLLKIVPFFYCLNEFNWRIIDTLAELLHFVVNELNTSGRRPVDAHRTDKSTFDARQGQFKSLQQYEQKEKNCPGGRHKVLSSHEKRVTNLKLMYGELVQFFGSHMHVCIGKGYPLSLLLRVFSLSFLLERQVQAQLSLESVCRALLSQLQLVNVLKSALEKGETAFDESVVDDFYLKTLKTALYHFQKEDAPEDELIGSSFQLKELRTRIDFLVRICDYLRNDDFHQLTKKKLPRRNQLFARREAEIPLLQLLDFAKTKQNPRHRQTQQIGKLRPRSSSNAGEQVDLQVLRYSLLYLIAEQIDRTKAYAYPQLSSIKNPYSLAGKKGFIPNNMVEKLLVYFGRSSDRGTILVYNFIRIFGDRIESRAKLLQEISRRVEADPIYTYPPFMTLFVEKERSDPSRLRELNYWRAPHIPVLLAYLSPQYQEFPGLQRYVTKVLAQLQADQILFYLPQIFQALPLRSGRIVEHFLLQYARRSSCFAHQLIWLAKVESKQERDPQNKSPRLPGVEQHLIGIQRAAKRLITRAISQFSREERGFFREVNDFFEQVTAISGKMRPQMLANDKKDIIRAEVERIVVPRSAYLPFNPTFQVVAINRDSGTPMQSAAKCPFLLTFRCVPYPGPDQHFLQRRQQRKQTTIRVDSDDDSLPTENIPKPIQSMSVTGSRVGRPVSRPVTVSLIRADTSSFVGSLERNRSRVDERQISCIFKVFDDIRQDCLALQIIALFQQIFERHKLGLQLFPYHTLPNRTGSSLDIGGIIEVVPNCVSRDSIGKTNQESLYEFFLSNFGAEHNQRFQEARQNFIRSQAAYSVVSYILQVKDRHNGNILVDREKGCLVHIDFGFILDISPAGNMRFERAQFKLTDEMIRIMGGSTDSEPFQLYLTLVIKGFLLARRYNAHLIQMVSLMARSGLPCFLEKSILNLENRFMLELSEIEAAEKMRQIVIDAADHWTTNWYDRIQWMQQKIYH